MQQQGFAVCRGLKGLQFCLTFLFIHFWHPAHLRKTWGWDCWVCFRDIHLTHRSMYQADESVLHLFCWTFIVFRIWFSNSWPWGPSIDKTQNSGLWKSKECNMFTGTDRLESEQLGSAGTYRWWSSHFWSFSFVSLCEGCVIITLPLGSVTGDPLRLSCDR